VGVPVMAINKISDNQFKDYCRPLYWIGSLMKTKRFQISAIITVWAITLLTSIVVPMVGPNSNKAEAAPTSWRWLNAQTIIDNENNRYLDDNPGDNTHLYFKQVTGLNCPNSPEINGHDTKVDAIDIRGWQTNAIQPSGGHDFWTVSPGNANNTTCSVNMTNGNINISDPQNSVKTYNWIDKNTIRHFKASVGDNGDMAFANRQSDATYKLLPSGEFQEQTSSACKSTIKPAANNSQAVLTFASVNPDTGGCNTQNYNISLALIENASLANAPGTPGGGGAGSGNAKPPESCETKSATNATGWFICSIINILDDVINFMDDQIQKYLIIDMSYFTDPRYVQTWGVIRNISLLILVPMMLIMVIGTALEIGPFDAYTVRKSLPRFLVAVLWIIASLSAYKFMVQLSNVTETGILGLITSAFGTEAQQITLRSLFNPTGGQTAGIFAALVAGTGLGIATGAVTLGVVFSFALVTAVGLGIGYLALQIRIVFAVGLGLVSSIAILPWIFPGNDKLWKLWKGTTASILLLGPILGLFIGTSRVLASLTEEWWLKLIFYVGVYALIITIIRSFGGVVGTVLNGFNDKARGFFDKQRKMRANSQQNAFGKFKAGERGPGFVKKAGFTTGAFMEAEKKGKFIGSALRNSGRMVTGGRKTGYYGEAVAQQTKLNSMRYAQTERAKATQEDDGYMLQALTYKSAAEAKARMGADWGANDDEIARSVSAANATGGFSEARQNYAARQLARTGTGYKDIEQMQRTVARVAGSNRSKASDLLGEMNAVTKNAGRHDLAAGFGNQMTMYEQIQARGGYEHVAQSGGNALSANEYREAHLQAAKDVDAVTLLRDKKTGVANMTEALGQSFNVAQQATIDARAIINNPASTAAQRATAQATFDHNRDEMTRLAGYIGKLEQSGAYASLTNVEEAGSRAVTPTSGAGATAPQMTPIGVTIDVPNAGRAGVQAQASPVQVQTNPVTGRTEQFNMKYVDPATGAVRDVIDPVTGRPLPAPNLNQDPRANELYRRHGPSSGGINPNDPNY
jgi:hypothetical protein